MNSEILAAIQKTLPAMELEVIKSELKKASEYEGLKTVIDQQQLINNDLTKNIRELKILIDTKNNEIDDLNKKITVFINRENQIQQIEIKQEMYSLNYQLNSQREMNEKFMDLVKTIFKNPTVSTTVSKHVTTPVLTNGYQSGSTNTSESVNTIVETR